MISSEISCPRCRIELEKVATIVADENHNMPLTPMVTVEPGRRIFVSMESHDGNRMSAFDFSGKWLADFAHFGMGPKELISVRDLVWVGKDRLYVFDRQRVLMFSSSGEATGVLTLPVPLVNHGLVLSSGDYIISTEPGRSDQEDFLVYKYSKSAKLLRSYSTELKGQTRETAWRMISLADKSTFSVHADSAYEFQLFDIESGDATRFTRQAEWFPPRPQASNRLSPTLERPLTRFSDIRHDSAGNAWTIVYIAKENWKPARPINETDYKKEHLLTVQDYADNLDTIVEVLDLKNGRVMARRRFSGPLLPTHEAGWVFVRGQSPDGIDTLTLFRVRLYMP